MVTNTSPLSYLHRLGRLEILRDLFGVVLVLSAVEVELARGRSLGLDLPEPRSVSWLEFRPSPPAAYEGLGAGETAALSLAASIPGALVLLDDMAARVRASALGLAFTGTAGVLIRAKGRGLLSAVAPELDRMLKMGFRLSPRARADALAACDEG